MGKSNDVLTGIVTGNPVDYLTHDDEAVRRLAVSACSACLDAATIPALTKVLVDDESEAVRAEAAIVLAGAGDLNAVWPGRSDASPQVVEAVAFACGEIGDQAAVPWLIETASDHEDALVREAAVAALGALGDERARPVLLAAARTERPQVRRRAIVALTAFDGDDVRGVFAQAALDRNPMVREVAEAILGRDL